MESTKQISRTRSFFSQVIAERLGQFSLLIFFRIIGAVIPLIITWYYSILVEKISDTVISKQLILSQVWQILIIIALLYVVELIVRRLIEYIITVMETATMKSLYDKCFDYLHKHSYQFFANNFA
jgi:ABC-type multidrug transport system fused ATPase/permease subunit